MGFYLEKWGLSIVEDDTVIFMDLMNLNGSITISENAVQLN